MNILTTKTLAGKWLALLIAAALALALAGCGGGGGGNSTPRTYGQGYNDGFARDSEYWDGYDDSWFTIGFEPILYDGDLIPFSDEDTYQAGFWDGLFDAYNDGYFVAYRYAFIIGFSDGYDNAYWPDYLDFLAADMHTEYLNGGFSDGYNDGFSEGRIFGAFDFEAFLPFDWLDAFLDWEAGTDLYFEEVDKGTGEFGPVILYEWAQNPHLLVRREAADDRAGTKDALSMRNSALTRGTADLIRDLTQDQTDALTVTPDSTSRTNRDLTITESWLERIDAYNNVPVEGRGVKNKRSR